MRLPNHINKAMLAIFLIVSVASFVVIRTNYAQARPQEFDGDRAFQDVEYQVSLGARIPDSPAHEKVREWIAAELEQAGWSAEIQPAEKMGHAIYNIVGKRGQGQPLIIIGAHYDSRLISDQDPDPEKRNQPVPGANDGASGVAILLELARTLPDLDAEIWLVFFDAEDNGNIPGWDWILGSTAFVEQLAQNPDAVVILDMLGDADLNIHFERSSDAVISEAIWQQAADLGYGDVFIPTPKYNILDDHLPFLRAGIPAVDIIDFDYPYWHTTADTPDKVSADSLKAVGDTIRAWLLSKQ